MDKDIDRVQITFVVFFLLAGITLIASFIFGKLIIMNYAGYTGMFIIGVLFLYTGLRRLSHVRKEGGKIVWYKQPWILVGILTLVQMLVQILVMILSSSLYKLF